MMGGAPYGIGGAFGSGPGACCVWAGPVAYGPTGGTGGPGGMGAIPLPGTNDCVFGLKA